MGAALSAPAATRAASRSRRPRSRSLGRRGLQVRAIQLGLLLVLFGGWQLSTELGWLSPAFTSAPSRFIPSFWHGLTNGTLLPLTATTLFETFVGFAIAAVLGVAAGIVLAEFPLIDDATRPFMTGFNTLPRIALAPLFVLWFGLGSLSRIVLVVSLGFFIVAINTYAGVRSVDRDTLLLARVLGAGRWRRFRTFVLPAAVPAIFAGLQLDLTYAFIGAVVGEMLSGSQGLGGYLAVQMGSFDIDAFFGGLFLLVIVALIVSWLVRLAESWLLRWRVAELHGTARR